MAYGFACTTCIAFPVHAENARRWPLTSAELRTEADGSINRTGLAVVETAFRKLAPESAVRLDGLHVLDEGICKSLILLLHNTFPVFQHIFTEINRSMLKNGASSLPLKGNAHEIRKLFASSIPILFLTETKNPKLQASCLLWLLIRIVYSKFLNLTMIDEIAPTFEQLGEKMEQIFGNRFFAHGGAELREHGTPADYSAAAYESANRLLSLRIDPYNTRGFDRQMMRK
uniref:Uncharacterized protein n=1 Tax=Panagrolaimus davidi TaxID=227884 RepID=A0A914RBL1_9BILA